MIKSEKRTIPTDKDKRIYFAIFIAKIKQSKHFSKTSDKRHYSEVWLKCLTSFD